MPAITDKKKKFSDQDALPDRDGAGGRKASRRPLGVAASARPRTCVSSCRTR